MPRNAFIVLKNGNIRTIKHILENFKVNIRHELIGIHMYKSNLHIIRYLYEILPTYFLICLMTLISVHHPLMLLNIY